jgi:hypothetical protein
VSLKVKQLLWLALLAGAGQSFAADPLPVKLGVRLGSHSILAGKSLVIHVDLLTADNQPAKAPRPFSVLLQARQPSGTVNSLQTTVIPAGQTTKQLTISPPGSGLVYIWAKHPELLPGGEYVAVRGAKASAAQPGPAPAPPPLAQSSLPQLTLRYSPDRKFLADGKDAVSVQAFLVGTADAAPKDIRINVYDSSNSLNPTPLKIPAGLVTGQSLLTSTQPGTVAVEFLGSAPSVAFQGDTKLNIQFMPPITRVSLQVSPPAISLVDTAELIVTLTDDGGRPIAADTPRQVAFSIDSGHGHIRKQEVQIPAGQFQARTTFAPEWSGPVSVSASTANLMSVTAPVNVFAPVVLLLCSALGGLAGGLLSRRTRRKSDRWRVLIGLATGFLFYWACIFLRLTIIGRSVVLNPLSALALSAVGGWLQTEVFTAVWGVLRPKVKT